MSKQHDESTCLFTDRIEMPSRRKFFQPFLMGAASLTNVIGSLCAVQVGAHMVKSPDPAVAPSLNPFYFTAMATSAVYLFANAYEVWRLWGERAETFAEIELKRRAETEFTGVLIGK